MHCGRSQADRNDGKGRAHEDRVLADSASGHYREAEEEGIYTSSNKVLVICARGTCPWHKCCMG